MQSKPILYSDVDWRQLNFPAIGKEIRTKGRGAGAGDDSGAAMCVYNITYGASKTPLMVQFPTVLSTIGLRKNLGDKYTIPITFTNVDPFGVNIYGDAPSETVATDPYFAQGKLYNFFKALQSELTAAVKNNSEKWLGAAKLTDERVKSLMNDVVKPHKDKIRDEATGKHAPMVSLEVGVAGPSTFDITVRGTDKKPIPSAMPNVLEALKTGVHFRGVFVFNGLFYVNNKFSATFTLLYAEVMPPLNSISRITASSFTFEPLEDTEEEQAGRALVKKARMETGFSATSTFLDSSRGAGGH